MRGLRSRISSSSSQIQPKGPADTIARTAAREDRGFDVIQEHQGLTAVVITPAEEIAHNQSVGRVVKRREILGQYI